MKRMPIVFGLVAVAVSTTLPAATVSVSSFRGTVYGPGEATLAFTGVDAEQELWVAWDDADKGADITQWSKSEQLGTIASGATSATNRLPDDARLGRAARFFLLPDGGTASDPLDLTAARSEDVFADAYIWMRGMAIDKNGNHILDDKIGEITNSLNTVALTTGSFGAAGHKPVISNEFVRLPGRGVGRQMQTLYFPQDVVWTNEAQTSGYVTPCSVTCGTPLTNFDSHYTWIVRFRPDFSAPLLDTQWLLGFGYGNSRGMMFGLAETSTERRKLQVHTYNSSWDLGESFVISNGCGWVDFAVTVDGQKVTAYLVKDGPTTPDGNTDIGLLKRVSRTYENSVNLVPSSGGYLRFGTESTQNGTYPMPAPSSGNNHYKCFRGSIQQFACWKRTLSEQEILAALGWPRAETWRVGVENDATTELSADTAPEGGFDVDGELWPVPNGGLTNGVSVSFKFPVEAGYDDGRAQIFRWKTTSDSAAGLLGVAVNGKSLGNRPVKAGATQSWVVPAAALKAGENVFSFFNDTQSGTDSISIDSVWLEPAAPPRNGTFLLVR